MNHLRTISMLVKRFATGSLALLLLVSAPAPVYVYADESCSPVASAPTGVNKPTGSDAVTYTYNSCTGLWENEHYTWNPSTYVTTPKVSPVYTYNASTKKWDTKRWTYAPASSSWIEVPESVDTPPAGAKTVGGPVAAPTPASTTGAASGTSSATGGNGSAVDTTTGNNTSVSDTNNTTVNNQIGSSSTSGDAAVTANTTGGNAASGNAQAIVNAVNMLQSSSALATAATFTINIDGDVQGDLVLDPNALQPATGTATINTANNLNVNVANNGSINNDITVAAQTGNANVTANTNGGNATSGNAQAVANVVNMLNSMIAAQQSFLGVINVNGNFNGNILMPQQFLDTLLSSNAPHETVAVSQEALNQINANLSNSTSIDNNVTSNAASGSATVSQNTNAGAATSGTATTNVTVFNLTNQQISGANTLLVFVNVMGKWIGVLMDAPAGSTAAAYGGGISTNTTNTANINASNTGSITNNIHASAQSGAANVSMNTNAGGAKSGNADTAVNLANITNSSINLTGWFGILFINVFGNWNGSFGVLKPHTSGASPAAPSNSQGVPQVFGFNPEVATTSRTHVKSSNATHINNSSSGSSSTGAAVSSENTVAANPIHGELASVAAKVLGAHVAAPTVGSQDVVRQDQNQALLFGGILFLTGMVMLAAEQIRSRRGQ